MSPGYVAQVSNKCSHITAIINCDHKTLCFSFQVKTMLSIVEEDRNLLQSKLNDEVTARHELEGRFSKITA